MLEKEVARAFLWEIENQALLCRVSFRNINQGLALWDQGTGAVDTYDLFYNIQGFLVSAANISKILWPSNENSGDRGEEIRAMLGVTEDSPLRSRGMRNHFEHFDERIEDWAKTGRPFADLNIGDKGVMASFLHPDTYLRHFDPAPGTVTFGGDVYVIPEIYKAVMEVGKRAHEELGKFMPDLKPGPPKG